MRKCCKQMQTTAALESIYFNEQINLSFTPNCQPTHTNTHPNSGNANEESKEETKANIIFCACACSKAFASIGSYLASVFGIRTLPGGGSALSTSCLIVEFESGWLTSLCVRKIQFLRLTD